MKKLIIFSVLVAALVLHGCKDNDDYFDSYSPDIDWYAVPEGATGPEADLRRDFYNQHGIYLMFNDTLGVSKRTTISGITHEEYVMLDYNYNMTLGHARDSLGFEIIRDHAEKDAGAKFVSDHLFKVLPELMRPFAILLVNNLEAFRDRYGTVNPNNPEPIAIYSAGKTYVISVDEIISLNEAEKDELAWEMLADIVPNNTARIPERDLQEFYYFSREYYDINSYTIPDPVQAVGFLNRLSYFNTKAKDVSTYAGALLSMTREEFMDEYGEYPVCVEKRAALVRVLRNIGIDLEL